MNQNRSPFKATYFDGVWSGPYDKSVSGRTCKLGQRTRVVLSVFPCNENPI